MLSGLAHKEAFPSPTELLGEHMMASSTFLTGVRPKRIGGGNNRSVGISMDQIAAQHLGKETQLSSLEVSLMANHDLVGLCEDNTSCAFIDTLFWSIRSFI